MNPRRIQLLGVGLTAIVCLQMVFHADRLAAESKWFGKKATSSRPTSAGTAAVPQNVLEAETEVADEADRESPVPKSGRPNEKRIKLNYLTKSWDDVLKDVAKQSDLALVMDKMVYMA